MVEKMILAVTSRGTGFIHHISNLQSVWVQRDQTGDNLRKSET